MFTDNILWHIWQYAGVKSYFLDRELITIIKEKRRTFFNHPLRISYILNRCNQKHYYSGNNSYDIGRANIYPEQIRHIDISDNIPIGKIYESKYIFLSQNIKDKIIPLSSTSTSGFNLKVVYWTIKSSWCDDERFPMYKILCLE